MSSINGKDKFTKFKNQYFLMQDVLMQPNLALQRAYFKTFQGETGCAKTS